MKGENNTDAHLRVVRDFFDGAESLRAEFDVRMADVRRVSKGRFIWDYWHVPDQYTYLRTPARDYFSRALLRDFLDQLRHWGENTVGCDAVTAPWLSYYVDGCAQALHTDVPHGPWAYVYSLTRWQERGFRGGETLLASPQCLHYWCHFTPESSSEQMDLLDKVAPEFNQLVVFDPRIPHGVEQVRGSHDPLDSRIVLHGWFKSPDLKATGEGDRRGVLDDIRSRLSGLIHRLALPAEIVGVVIGRLEIGAQGNVTSLSLLTDNLVHRHADEVALAHARQRLLEHIGNWQFAAPAGPVTVLLPITIPPGIH